MSIKTLRKRIALVAVSALGAGLLTVASVAPARADIDANELVVQPIEAGGNSLATICAVDNTGDVNTAVVPVTSPGFLIGGTTGLGSGEDAYLTITGPGLITALGASWTAVSQTIASATALSATTSTLNDITIKPTATGTIKITYAASTGGAAVDVITVTVVATCANAALSVSSSLFKAIGSTSASTTVAFSSASTGLTDNVDESGATTVAEAGTGYLALSLKDAYGAALSETKTLIASTKDANCLVELIDRPGSAPSFAGTSSTSIVADGGSDDLVLVAQSDSDVPAKCTVSVTWNGLDVGTKTFIFRGIPSSVTVSDVTVGRTSGNGYYRVTVADAAGNPIPGVVISASSSEANNAAALASGVITAVQAQSGAQTTSTATSIGKTRAIDSTSIAMSAGAHAPTYYTCSSSGGTAKLTVRALISSATGTYATSAPFNVACGGALDTWSISLDKASYAPGEIATLTLTGKDVKGMPVSTFTLLSGVSYAFGGMTAVTAPTDNDAFTSGIGTKTYQFSVGTSEGSFVGTFKTTGTTDTAAKTVQYKVAATSASVTTNEVLAAIVKLIATINKQIRQLQKQLRR